MRGLAAMATWAALRPLAALRALTAPQPLPGPGAEHTAALVACAEALERVVAAQLAAQTQAERHARPSRYAQAGAVQVPGWYSLTPPFSRRPS